MPLSGAPFQGDLPQTSGSHVTCESCAVALPGIINPGLCDKQCLQSSKVKH